MKKALKYYKVIWLALLALFNVIAFVTPTKIVGTNKYDGGFWLSYCFVMAAFIVHLGYVCRMFSGSTLVKTNRKATPAITISSVELLIMIIVGLICMLVPRIDKWIGIIACSVVFALSVIFLMFIVVVEEWKDGR